MVIPEGADAPEPTDLMQCKLCDRKFVPKAHAIHSRICAKVFESKRKQFNSKSNRAEGTDIAQFEQESGVRAGSRGGAAKGARQPLKQQRAASAVGRCRLPASKPELKACLVSALETRIWGTAFKICFPIQLAPLHRGGGTGARGGAGQAPQVEAPERAVPRRLARREVGRCRLTV
jgi:hypothetical protein